VATRIPFSALGEKQMWFWMATFANVQNCEHLDMDFKILGLQRLKYIQWQMICMLMSECRTRFICLIYDAWVTSFMKMYNILHA